MSARSYRKFRYPWRTATRLHLLRDGDVFFPRMLEAIGSARQYILLEMYLFESGVVADRFIDALLLAVQRGVRACVLLDHFGSLGLSQADFLRLRQGGVEMVLYNRLRIGQWFNNFARDHRKLLLVDGATAFVGGVGITDDFDPPGAKHRRWRETMVEFGGPVVADWQEMFVALWNTAGGPRLQLTPPAMPAANDGIQTRAVVSAGPLRQENMRVLIKHVRAAEHRVWISTAYFVPGWRFLHALYAAAHQGVDVRLMLPGKRTDHPGVRHAGRRYYARLLRNGVRIFEYQPRILHSKLAVCDQWVSAGSSNHDRWNLRWNLEANLVVDDQPFAAQVVAMFENDFSDCVEIKYDQWLQRPWYVLWWEGVWARVDLWLNQLGRGRGGD
jgi:phosphatidylserine/phosphatidylglycerophosphate/cardiolipin synthase-like enzyme